MERRVRSIVLAAVLAAPLMGAAPAGAGPLACGTTLTASTTLTADMTCPGDATMLDNLAGVFIIGSGNHIAANDIVGEAGDDRGILAFNPNRITGNRVSRYGGPAGIELLNGGDVSGNQVFANVDGIRARGGATVSGNVVSGNTDDGIDAGAGAVLQGNIALQNADLGIAAGPGVIDAGGNRAFANGNPLQCVGVACS